jgi:carboxyl-terminal processing protease
MRLSLVGVGAVLTQDEGYAKIRELVPGGPASRDGRLKVGDRITGVAQGKEEFVDTLDLKLDKVVEMIRGKKNTLVRLQVWPAAATDSSVRKVIEITRAEVKLTEQEAKAELIEHISPDGSKSKLGWIVLPSFYAEMERTGSPDAKSTTRDVLVLINRLKKEGIDGLVIDLRRNGGGSLEEAVNLTGLFIKRGPVVLARDSSGHNSTLRDKDDRIAYDGPLVVLTNRLSASASEIFAAALQDYGRAIVVGDTATFGKGTVQTMVDLARTMPFAGASSGAGALKLTIQKFYRVAGGSTQLQGVVSDIHLPSLYDQTEIGEASLKGPLPYDTIDPVDFERWSLPLYINEIKKRSMSRVSSDREFQWIMEDTARYKKRVAENSLSLNEKARRTEIEADKARKERREKERAAIVVEPDKAFAITIAKADGGPLEPVIREAKKKSPEVAVSAAPGADLGTGGEPKKVVESPVPAGQPANSAAGVSDDDAADDESGPEVAVDAIRLETVRILGDLIELTKAGTKSVVPVAPVPLNPQNTAQTR